MRIATLDIGGTAIKSGIWEGDRIREFREWDTNASLGGKQLMERVSSVLHTCGKFDAIGISTAGQVDAGEGRIHYANENIPGYTGMPVREMLEREFQVPVAVENDVNAAALGEMYAGAARGIPDFLCLTYGTGVGGAIVTGGELLRGSSFAGGSFGGILIHPEDIRPGDTLSGCYERYASTTALVRQVRQIDAGLNSGRKIFESLEQMEVRKAVDQWIDEIVFGLVTLVNIFNPADILLGGGVMAQSYIIEEVRKRVVLRVAENVRNIRIRQMSLGNQAGLVGAARLARQLC